MTTAHQIVVSAENNPYIAWQCKLFYFSCVTRMDHQPIVIVHDWGEEWHPDFYELAKAGCAIYSAPNYRFDRDGNDYACRNHPGSLLRAAELFRDQDVRIVLCDPDMVFVRAVEFPDVLAGEFSSFMDYDRDFVNEVLPKFGVTRATLDSQKDSLCVSVPYAVPSKVARELGETWLSTIELFSPRRWEDVMYAFGLSTVKLGLRVEVTHLVDHNYWPEERVQAPMIHYAYGDERWNKRDYGTGKTNREVWNPPDNYPPDTILGELANQIREARDFYHSVFV
jgi:hypothetical protein